ncbi:hypothetical protein [Tahibacter sp.]|uniref:hypothetical protein n=1 Tax=Tahibacter sp. TaxID=2056211 RepID=UPI0028C46C51|nr:hypothetical protein [Tahibacter sp.]
MAEILGKGDLDAVAKAVAVEQLLQSKELATRAIDCIPEAFGAVLVGHMGNIGLPARFKAKSHRGAWCEFSLNDEPIFGEALAVATSLYHNGPKELFASVALQSAMVNTVNRALQAGQSIEGASFSSICFLGVSAEMYTPPRGLLHRLFGAST